MGAIREIIGLFGGDPSSVLDFDDGGPLLLPYATLTAARDAGNPEFLPLQGVYEWQGRPLLLLVDGTQVQENPEIISRLRRAAAMRGDAPYLGLVQPGRLTVYQVGLDDQPLASVQIPIPSEENAKRTAISYLGNSRPGVVHRNWISDVVLRLLTAAIDQLISENVEVETAVSLVGRALFVRFLGDRNLLNDRSLPAGHGDPNTLFDDVVAMEATTQWLDETFNGDFLPLPDGYAQNLTPQAFWVLGNILRRSPGGQLTLEWKEDWNRLDFAQIPVGVLSQAYERYLSKHDPEAQRREGGFYTPRHIAELMVKASFRSVAMRGIASEAKVLDPAAGAGVFLITAFRQLVAERWQRDGRRPDTSVLREILYNQITGFDINESALRFAALGLYLISIELDADPEPIRKLRFRDLRPKVLRRFESGRRLGLERGTKEPIDVSLGSLGPEVGIEHEAAYDIVIGNPPWAASTQLRGWAWLQRKVTEIARNRVCEEDLVAPLPNEALDLPFVWRALEWAKPHGQIAFALHARILFSQGETMPQARAAIFKALNVTGIVNGTELRTTKVWPEVTAPFCLVFARNERPAPGSAFRFVSPRLEEALNKSGAWRVDAGNAVTVSNEEVWKRPELLKILFRGSRLDLEIYDRFESKGWPTLKEYWGKLFGETKGRPRFTGNGYQRLRKSSEVRKESDGLPGEEADYLLGLPNLDAEVSDRPVIDGLGLGKFSAPRVHRRRPEEIYKAPLLLVAESPRVSKGRIQVSVATVDVAFSQSFHGYSAHAHVNGDLLTKYLALIIGSRIALWFSLITSGRFGFERDVVEKFTIDSIVIPPMENLDAEGQTEVFELFNRITNENNDDAWLAVDKWVALRYGLSVDDVQILSDTLTYNLPFAENRRTAQKSPTEDQIACFKSTLEAALAAWATRFERNLKIQAVTTPLTFSWRFMRIGGCATDGASLLDLIGEGIVQAADTMAATEIILADQAHDCLWLGHLNQARYWSSSEARLAARRIIWDHITFLQGDE